MSTMLRGQSAVFRACRPASGLVLLLWLILGDPSAFAQGVTNPPSPAAAAPDASPETDAAGDTEAGSAEDLAFLKPVLLSQANDPAVRRGAAERILGLGTPDSIACLSEALASHEPGLVLAVVRAMESRGTYPPELLPTLLEALKHPAPESLDALTVAVGRYGDAAIDDVAAAALAGDAPVDERLGAIHALRAFRNRVAAEYLVAVLDPAREETEPTRAVARDSLQHLTGFAHGWTDEQWRQWWEGARSQSQRAWLATLVQQLSEHIRTLQQQMNEESRKTSSVQQRLLATYRDLFPSLSREEQLRRLPMLMEDDLAAVRQFAIERVDRLLRDSVRLPEPLQAKLAERLMDPDPGIRLTATNLLDELNYAGTVDLIASRLGDEPNEAVARAYLDVLAKRPTPKAFAHLTDRLGTPAFCEPAAEALWALVRTGALDESQVRTAGDAARAAHGRQPGPATARLLGALGTDADVNQLAVLLDDDDPVVRRHVAEAFAYRGLRQPLLARADDPVVYPFALQVTAAGEPSPATFQQLSALRPPDEHRTAWEARLQALASQLTPADLLAADDMLRAIEYAGVPLRIAVLERAAEPAANNAASIPPPALLVRYASLLIDNDRAARAFSLLERYNGESATPALLELKFQAALLVGQYDTAEQVSDDHVRWLAALAQFAESRPEAARPLCTQIEQRFGQELSQEMRARLDGICTALDQGSPPASAEDPAAERTAADTDHGPPGGS